MADGRPSERGIFEVADDAGNVITDFNRLRLGPGMSMYYKPEDPSCVIDAGGALVGGNSFPSISALRSLLTPPSSSSSYSTLGYYSPGDGGGSFYMWDPVSTATDDGGSVIKLTFRATGRMKLVLTSGRWNVRGFGAKGDGAATDLDRDAIRAAEAAAHAHPFIKKVYAPAGKYNMLHGSTSGGELPWSILLHDNIHLCGDGASTIFIWPGTAPPGPIVADPMDHQVVMTRGSNITISDITFQGENGDADGNGYRHPSDTYAEFSAIEEWFVFGAPEIHTNIVVNNCQFLNLYGFSAHDQGGQWHGGRFSNNFSFCCANGENLCGYDLQHINNVFVSSEGIETSGAKQIISGNYLSCPHGGTSVISLTGFVSSPDFTSNSAVITGNLIDGLGSEASAPACIIAGTYTDLAITNNVIRNSTITGIETAGCSRVTISNNTILRDREDSISGVPSGIFCNGLHEGTICGNAIYGGGFVKYGIELTGCQIVTVVGNNSRNCVNADFFFETCDGFSVIGNFASSSSSASGFEFQASADATVTGNWSYGHTIDMNVNAACSFMRFSQNSYGTHSFLVVCQSTPVQGPNIPDADTTVSISTGSQFDMNVVSANRIVTLGTTGSPVIGEEIKVNVNRANATTVTIKDDAGTTLLVVPVSIAGSVRAVWNGTHFDSATFVRTQ